MNWPRSHPYASALCVAGALVVAGAFIVVRRTAAPEASTIAWGGSNAQFLNPTSYTPAQTAPPNQAGVAEQAGTGQPSTGPLAPAPNTDPKKTPAYTGDSFNFEAFVASLSSAQSRADVGGQADTGGSGVSPYTFIPSGLMATTAPPKSRSTAQQELYDYGNDIGSYIQSFEEQHTGAVQILKNQAEDRSNPAKAAAVGVLARALEDTGKSISNMDTVPGQAASLHTALAKSYTDIGANLALIPKAERDADFIRAVETYNASADVFTRNYIALAQLFGAFGVVFSPSDAGSVFTFTPTGF